ncbi:MAG: aldo/keto reductase [Treponema sp.]|jgi:aryl-alcohol dehydrogenase-like predicted oxidoreductase|nr:aldo/keto reductase [Treponema sp.]
MEYKEIMGRRVSAMSLGTVQLGMNYGIANQEGKPAREKCFAILDAAFKGGVNALDTARSYGDSEEVLGAYFARSPGKAERAFITPKLASGLPPGTAAAEVEGNLLRSAETSLEKLGLPRVNCFLLHNAEDMIHGSATAQILLRLVKENYTDMAGVSVYHPEEIGSLLKDDVYQAVQIPLNVFDQRFIRSGALEQLRRRNIHVFVRSVFFQGLLFLDPEGVRDPDLLRYAVPHLRTLRRLSEEGGMSIGQFAVSFLRDMPGISSLVLGADNPEQVVRNTAFFEAPPLSGALRRKAEDAFKDLNYPGIMAVLSRPKQGA